jgi:hypothetical protein
MKETSVQVVYTDPGGIGYHRVYYMAQLAAYLGIGCTAAWASYTGRPIGWNSAPAQGSQIQLAY